VRRLAAHGSATQDQPTRSCTLSTCSITHMRMAMSTLYLEQELFVSHTFLGLPKSTTHHLTAAAPSRLFLPTFTDEGLNRTDFQAKTKAGWISCHSLRIFLPWTGRETDGLSAKELDQVLRQRLVTDDVPNHSAQQSHLPRPGI